jgi:hypothetical protein
MGDRTNRTKGSLWSRYAESAVRGRAAGSPVRTDYINQGLTQRSLSGPVGDHLPCSGGPARVHPPAQPMTLSGEIKDDAELGAD